MSSSYKSPPIKPRITIHPTRSLVYPWEFRVTWKRNHFKNTEWHTFDEALIAAGVKQL